jgi:hypothetical protein
MKRKFKVISSSIHHFENIEFNFVIEDDSIGAKCNVLGGSFIIIQNGRIIGLTNKEWILMLLDVTPEVIPEKPKLVINENVEIFIDDKEIHISEKCTYKELYNFLEVEWQYLNFIPGVSVAFPLELRGDTDLLLKNHWNIIGFENISEGSFERQSFDGRSI